MGLGIPSELPPQPPIGTYRQIVENHFNQSPTTADLSVEQILAHIRSGVDLDQIAFREGNITYWNLWNIDRNTNPQFYTDSSDTVDNNYE